MLVHWPGIEPGPPAWQARILPLNYQCCSCCFAPTCSLFLHTQQHYNFLTLSFHSPNAHNALTQISHATSHKPLMLLNTFLSFTTTSQTFNLPPKHMHSATIPLSHSLLLPNMPLLSPHRSKHASNLLKSFAHCLFTLTSHHYNIASCHSATSSSRYVASKPARSATPGQAATFNTSWNLDSCCQRNLASTVVIFQPCVLLPLLLC